MDPLIQDVQLSSMLLLLCTQQPLMPLQDAIDLGSLTETLRKLSQGFAVDVPVYDFTKHQRRCSVWRGSNSNPRGHCVGWMPINLQGQRGSARSNGC